MNRPSILLITTDQLRRDALGCYGGRAVQTPHIDALAAAGTTYDAAYTASPWCLPSRSSLVTGLYPHHHGAYSNFRDVRLDPGRPNLFGHLRELGYRNTVVGKCHFAPVAYDATSPQETLPYEEMREYYLSLGIDDLDLQDDKQVSVWFRDDYARELDEAGLLGAYRDAVWDAPAGKVFEFPGPAQWHPDAWVGRKTVERIEAGGDGPQFVWMSLSGPHFPFDPPKEYLDRVDTALIPDPASDGAELEDERRIHWRSRHASPGRHGSWIESGDNSRFPPGYWERLRHHYLANVALIDDVVGDVVAAARARFGEELVVVFLPDHGEMLGNHGMWGKGYCFYEDVLRIPLFVLAPGTGPDGGRSSRLVSSVDVLPTLLEALGAPPVADLDGRSLAGADEHEVVLSEGQGFLTVTDGRDKLVHVDYGDSFATEFFDLRSDPDEVHDRSGDPALALRQASLQERATAALLRAVLP